MSSIPMVMKQPAAQITELLIWGMTMKMIKDVELKGSILLHSNMIRSAPQDSPVYMWPLPLKTTTLMLPAAY